MYFKRQFSEIESASLPRIPSRAGLTLSEKTSAPTNDVRCLVPVRLTAIQAVLGIADPRASRSSASDAFKLDSNQPLGSRSARAARVPMVAVSASSNSRETSSWPVRACANSWSNVPAKLARFCSRGR